MNIQKLQEMIKEPASKEWFAKHGNKNMNPKTKALNNISQPSYKYYEGKIPRTVGDESRTEQIERINHHSKMSGIISKARERHERRHTEKGRTSKAEALERIKSYSAER